MEVRWSERKHDLHRGRTKKRCSNEIVHKKNIQKIKKIQKEATNGTSGTRPFPGVGRFDGPEDWLADRSGGGRRQRNDKTVVSSMVKNWWIKTNIEIQKESIQKIKEKLPLHNRKAKNGLVWETSRTRADGGRQMLMAYERRVFGGGCNSIPMLEYVGR